jgi:glycosyltransferase involved in cell wall biosynthesis
MNLQSANETQIPTMNILMAAPVPKRREGGVAAIAYSLGEELATRGHGVDYIFLEDLLTGEATWGRFREFTFAMRLAKHIQKNRQKYSVVNIHAPAGAVYGLLRKRSPNLPPYVMTLHGLEERRVHVMQREVKKGRAWHFSTANKAWHFFYHRPRFFLSIKTADFAHCYSRDVWNVLQLVYNLDSERTAYIANGVGERFFTQRQYADRRPLRLLYAGTWLDQRGIFYIREALESLNKRFCDWTFTIAGSGVSDEELFRFFGDNLRSQIVPMPIVPVSDMPQLHAEHDVLVFPSLMEGLPSVLLEAMASGMAVITAETCGMVDVVEDGRNGLLVPPADSAALEDAICRLAQCPDLRKQLGTAARETMRRYTWKKAADKLEKVFHASLAERPRA